MLQHCHQYKEQHGGSAGACCSSGHKFRPVCVSFPLSTILILSSLPRIRFMTFPFLFDTVGAI